MEYDSASPGEILLAACYQENPDLLNQILDDELTDIHLLNNSRDGVGNTALHLSVQHGSIACLNILLDIQDLEMNSKNFLEENTPLHKAVEYQYKDKDIALEMSIYFLCKHKKYISDPKLVESLINAGADPRIKNKMKQKPIDLVDRKNNDIQSILKKAELAYFIEKNDIQNIGNKNQHFLNNS
ncbi:uncharacterized protein T551_00243 [Pneumocystis jirovecii RU7]|uniref:Uncharacterized protein n=1 Tax=Pneumocystis jirovecii (strain RU7) TaxID=1408657 RepID=A0A0W4ZWK6_PNEJ7|nr:uncharacterized protein T551_00243 [Pneumocystis jirovecii RU7]KTW32758.1 hypothetical protein T551_00243 [Pneumocystis jirovecii RU7]